jgi:ribosomal protein S27AE
MPALVRLYEYNEELVDSTRGKCPECPKGLLLIDLDKSFKLIIGNNEYSFDVIVCDRCSYNYLEKWISLTDKIKIESD